MHSREREDSLQKMWQHESGRNEPMYRDVGKEARLPKKKWSLRKAILWGFAWSAVIVALHFQEYVAELKTLPFPLGIARIGGVVIGGPLFAIIIALVRN